MTAAGAGPVPTPPAPAPAPVQRSVPPEATKTRADPEMAQRLRAFWAAKDNASGARRGRSAVGARGATAPPPLPGAPPPPASPLAPGRRPAPAVARSVGEAPAAGPPPATAGPLSFAEVSRRIAERAAAARRSASQPDPDAPFSRAHDDPAGSPDRAEPALVDRPSWNAPPVRRSRGRIAPGPLPGTGPPGTTGPGQAPVQRTTSPAAPRPSDSSPSAEPPHPTSWAVPTERSLTIASAPATTARSLAYRIARRTRPAAPVAAALGGDVDAIPPPGRAGPGEVALAARRSPAVQRDFVSSPTPAAVAVAQSVPRRHAANASTLPVGAPVVLRSLAANPPGEHAAVPATPPRPAAAPAAAAGSASAAVLRQISQSAGVVQRAQTGSASSTSASPSAAPTAASPSSNGNSNGNGAGPRETSSAILDRIDEIVDQLEERVLAELERRGGRFTGYF